jgi:MOSC domain-containing protein YiiM
MALKDGETLKDLMVVFPRTGRIEWIGLRPLARQPMRVVETAELVEARGLRGDHRAEHTQGKRQITLIQQEHLAVIAQFCGRDTIDPAWLRRNLVISGVNLLALYNRRFYLGTALAEVTGYCQPCSRMEELLGPEGYNAMRGHGGISARILKGGTIAVGDLLRAVTPAEPTLLQSG